MNRQDLIQSGEQGTIYILHLDSKLAGVAQHYIGFAIRLEQRLAHHRKGTGARFTRAANEAGIQYSIAADWPGTRNLERAMKERRNHKLWCPVCMGDKARDPTKVKWRDKKPVEVENENNTTDLGIQPGV